MKIKTGKSIFTYSKLTNLYNITLNFKRLRKKEIQSLGGPNEFTEFYTRFKTIVQFHKKNPGGPENNVTVVSLKFKLA